MFTIGPSTIIRVTFRNSSSRIGSAGWLHLRTAERFGIKEYQTIWENDLLYPEMLFDHARQMLQDVQAVANSLEVQLESNEKRS